MQPYRHLNFSPIRHILDFKKLFIYFLAMLDLHCCASFFLAEASRAYSLAASAQVLIAVASLLVERGF